jgi:predicted nucleic acid-binding Zn ribbon protein
VKRHWHIYDCEDCIVSFAVEAAFEDQDAVNCPVCGKDESLIEVGYGEM